MAKVNQRLWKIPGQRTKRARPGGLTAQLPCNPCPHRHPTTAAVLHPEGVRQVRQYKAEWSKEDAEKGAGRDADEAGGGAEAEEARRRHVGRGD